MTNTKQEAPADATFHDCVKDVEGHAVAGETFHSRWEHWLKIPMRMQVDHELCKPLVLSAFFCRVVGFSKTMLTDL